METHADARTFIRVVITVDLAASGDATANMSRPRMHSLVFVPKNRPNGILYLLDLMY